MHAFWNEHEQHIGTSLYGRLYEKMRVWESDDWLRNEAPVVREYAGIWRNADKVVYSTSPTDVSTARTRIERQFEPEKVRRLKETTGSDLSIGGAGLAAEAFRHRRLVDECVLLQCPGVVGGGKPALPRGLVKRTEASGVAGGVMKRVLIHPCLDCEPARGNRNPHGRRGRRTIVVRVKV